LKKEVRKKFETSDKICGYVVEEGESEDRVQDTTGPKKGPKNF